MTSAATVVICRNTPGHLVLWKQKIPQNEENTHFQSLVIICLFVYSHTSNFSAIWRLSPLPVTGLQILAYARRSGPLSREGSLSCHTYSDTGPRFIQSHPKDRHLLPTVGFEPSLLKKKCHHNGRYPLRAQILTFQTIPIFFYWDHWFVFKIFYH
jgi:hypothetical protein